MKKKINVINNKLRNMSLSALFFSLFISHQSMASEILPFKVDVVSDYKNFYTLDRFTRLAIAGSAMGVVANTAIDREIYNWYQDDIRSSSSNDFSKIAKFAGEGKYLLPLSVLASHALNFDSDSSLGAWGSDVARAYTVGLPLIWTSQYLTGASRPIELNDSDWRPFEDNNGVSGHAFIGAVPFLAIAKKTDNKYLKYIAYFSSGLTAWSRINDGAHYTSQAILGWYIAYEALDAITETNHNKSAKVSYAFQPIVAKDAIGVNFQLVW